MEEAPAASFTEVEKSSPLHDEEEDNALHWEGFVSLAKDNASRDTIFQLVVDGAAFDSRLIVSNNVPDMRECIYSLLGIVGNEFVLCTGIFISILG